MSVPLLEVSNIHTFYGEHQALFGASFTVNAGDFVTLLGRNGMGKSTSVKSVMGMLQPQRGHIVFRGERIVGYPAHRVARLGIGLIPEGRGIFPNLSVRENLVATAHNRLKIAESWTLEAVYRMFPLLKEREVHSGGLLSGGEQQMLAIGRALMTNPTLLIFDEATEGLSPLVRAAIWSCLKDLKARGMSMIVIDKNIGPLLKLADRHFIFEKGRVVWQGTTSEFNAQKASLHEFIGI